MENENVTLSINRTRIQFEIFEEETVIINVENGLYYSLSKSGSEVLQLIDNGYTPKMVITSLLGNSEKAKQYGPDIMHFIELLIQENILVKNLLQPTAEQPIAIRNPIYSFADEFQIPLLEQYDEVQELLLIDPIHMVDQSKGWPKT